MPHAAGAPQVASVARWPQLVHDVHKKKKISGPTAHILNYIQYCCWVQSFVWSDARQQGQLVVEFVQICGFKRFLKMALNRPLNSMPSLFI